MSTTTARTTTTDTAADGTPLPAPEDMGATGSALWQHRLPVGTRAAQVQRWARWLEQPETAPQQWWRDLPAVVCFGSANYFAEQGGNPALAWYALGRNGYDGLHIPEDTADTPIREVYRIGALGGPDRPAPLVFRFGPLRGRTSAVPTELRGFFTVPHLNPFPEHVPAHLLGEGPMAVWAAPQWAEHSAAPAPVVLRQMIEFCTHQVVLDLLLDDGAAAVAFLRAVDPNKARETHATLAWHMFHDTMARNALREAVDMRQIDQLSYPLGGNAPLEAASGWTDAQLGLVMQLGLATALTARHAWRPNQHARTSVPAWLDPMGIRAALEMRVGGVDDWTGPTMEEQAELFPNDPIPAARAARARLGR